MLIKPLVNNWSFPFSISQPFSFITYFVIYSLIFFICPPYLIPCLHPSIHLDPPLVFSVVRHPLSLSVLLDNVEGTHFSLMHSWYSEACLRLRCCSRLLMLPPPATTLARLHLQLIVWSMSNFLNLKYL